MITASLLLPLLLTDCPELPDPAWPIFAATDYGVIADDGQDDAPALFTAILAATAADGGVVELPAGQIDVGHEVRILSNVFIRGAPGTTVRIHGPIDGFWANGASSIGLGGFRLQGDLRGSVGTLVSLTNVTGMLMEDMQLVDANHDAIHALIGCSNLCWIGNTVDGAGDDGLNPGGGAGGVGTNDVLIQDNVVRNVANDGIHVSLETFDIAIIDNHIEQCGQGVGLIGCRDSWIEGNTIDQCGSGIRTVGESVFGPTPGISVVGNTITESGPIRLDGACGAVVGNDAHVTDISGFSLVWGNTTEEGNTPGDVTCDESVGVDDLLSLFAAWGPAPPLSRADLDCSGVVDIADLLILLGGWTS